ncbi:MFS general substrate transporter [Ramaria rubella]|nr:MFS general substrate transporter [Ramaria rubella]
MTEEATSAVSLDHERTLEGSPPPVEPKEFNQRTKDFGFLPILPHLRYYADRPQKFGILLRLTFVAATTFTVQNLYYCQPLLITLSEAFDVSYSEVSRIPTLTQAGYAVGLLFITPLGDLIHRRPLLLGLVLCSASLSIGLALTNSVVVFEVLSFLVGLVTVTPQVLLPLAADLAPPNRRAAAISVVFGGLLFGILLARVLAGIIANFSSWRNVFFMAIGLQYAVLGLLYFFLPDYPAKNPGTGYFGILKSMAWFAVSEPILVQASIVSCASSATFTSFWVTLTFLLGGPPYHFSDLKIGLFGFIGMLGVCTAPLVGRFIDTLVPWNASVLATLILLVFQAVQTSGGGISIAAVILACFGLDVGRQMQQVSLSSAIFGIDPKARARLNAVYMVSIFLGQLMGTASGTKVFVEHGWRATAYLSLAWMGMQLGILLIRGPHSPRKTWFGWQGGWSLRRRSGVGELEDTSKPQNDTSDEKEASATKDIESDAAQDTAKDTILDAERAGLEE